MGCSAGPQVERWCRTPGVFSSLIAVDQVGPVGAEAFDEAEGQQGVVHRGAGVLVQRPHLLVEPTGVRLRVVRQLAATQMPRFAPKLLGKTGQDPKCPPWWGRQSLQPQHLAHVRDHPSSRTWCPSFLGRGTPGATHGCSQPPPLSQPPRPDLPFSASPRRIPALLLGCPSPGGSQGGDGGVPWVGCGVPTCPGGAGGRSPPAGRLGASAAASPRPPEPASRFSEPRRCRQGRGAAKPAEPPAPAPPQPASPPLPGFGSSLGSAWRPARGGWGGTGRSPGGGG